MADHPASNPDAALRSYRAKRDFKLTSEPAECGAPGADGLAFVVQKHWASRLHYDFRLELDGTMKSWAVPKGPSYDPKDKRMAVHVEDHPLSYAGFEGSIPEKQYGAGKVIVWDKGLWSPVGDPREGYRKGELKFDLHGHKLHGRWVLVRMKGKGEGTDKKQEPWLLIKERDAHVRPAAEFSVVDEMPDSVKALGAPPLAAAVPVKPKKVKAERPALPPEAKPAKLPDKLAPQLAVLADAPPRDASAWVYEIKFDGYRMLARIDADDIRLFTRNGNDWTGKLGALKRSLAQAKLPPGWYDGEIVVPNAKGVPDFGALQNSFDSSRTENIVFYVFDLPYFDGHDLRAAPLQARRAQLESVLGAAPADRIRFSAVFDAPAASMVESACALGLEGIIGKRRDAPYRSTRSADWIKLKCQRRQEFVIAGYTEPAGSRTDFGALLLGVHGAGGQLEYAGNVGTGFSQRVLGDIKRKLDALASSVSPFAKGTKVEGRPHWVRPTLVAEVSFGEWTQTGRIRHAVFRGLRTDKDASAIVREKELAMDAPEAAPHAAEKTGSRTRKSAAAPATTSAAEGLAAKVKVSNPQRVIDPSTGLTKIDLVRYFDLVGELFMPHLKGRPVSLVRAPSGIGGELFFQKHAESDKLPGVRQLDAALFPGHPPMIEIASRQGILSVAQWNTVEIHTQNGCAKSFEHPDRMVFDLDPGEGVGWRQVQEAAQLVHAFLDELGLPAFLKTSGGKGLHVLVPVRKGHDWDAVKGFSQAVVAHMAETVPQRFVAKSGPKNRIGKIFIDYLRNGIGATTVAAWSARARPGLGISVPVDWSELMSLRGGDHWTVRTAHERLARGNAPWAAYAKSARSLSAAMRKLGYRP